MHQPPAFIESNDQTLRKLAAMHPLATLVLQTCDELLVNHVPLLWEGQRLHGHLASNNQLIEVLREAAAPLSATAIFHGPEGYVSPADYPSKAATGKVVPTWNYAVLHIVGQLHLNADPTFIRSQVDRLTAQQEQHANPDANWTLEDAPASFAAALLNGIVGIELAIGKVTGKYKLSQNRPAADREGARLGVADRGLTELAQLMEQTENSPPEQ